jgi:hypothetical protein
MSQQASAGNLNGQARRLLAVRLRLAGLTYAEVAAKLGVSEQRAWQLVRAEVQRLNRERKEAAAELQRLELERLDRLHAAFWDRALEGDLDAAGVVLKVMARRARLLGLDAPPKREADPTVRVEVTVEQVIAARARVAHFRDLPSGAGDGPAGADRANPDRNGQVPGGRL